MKKYSWILALFTALTMAFVFASCGDDGGGGKKPEKVVREWATVFNMLDASDGLIDHGIQGLTAGTDLSFANNANPIKPLVKAGDMPAHITSFQAVDGEEAGEIALKYVTVATWGPGFDLPDSAFSFFGGDAEYAEGDTIIITGKAEGAAIDLALNKNQGAAQQIIGNQVTAAGDFTIEATLTAEDVTAIKGNEQGVIRFEDRKGATTVTIYNIVIEGYRPVEVKKLDKPVTTLNGTVLSWTAVSSAAGYKVLALATGGTTPEEISLGSSVTSWDIAASALAPTKYTEAAVTYSVTLVALGDGTLTLDSDASNAVSMTKDPPQAPPSIKVTVNGVDQNVDLYAAGPGTAVAKLADPAVGYSITYGTGQYGATYAYFEVDFGTGKTLADYAKLTLKWKGTAGDIGWKNFKVFASDTEFTGSVSENGYAAQSNFAAANTSETAGTFYLNAPSVTGQKAFIAITIWAGATGGTPAVATAYEVYDIAFESYTPQAVTLKEIPGVDAPVAGVAPKTTVTSAQYTGTIVWKDASDATLTGDFATSTVYTATITLAAIPPYTFTGVAQDFFEVAGATVSYTADSNIVTATFPATGATALTSFTITGVGDLTLADLALGDSFTAQLVPGGIELTGGNWDWEQAKISITLPAGKTLADLASVTLNLTGVTGGATSYKTFHLKAGKPIPGGQIDPETLNDIAPVASTGSVANGTAVPLSFAVDQDLVEALGIDSESVFEISIFASMQNVSYTFTNITFVFN
jgi:hypothetical protein